MNVEESGFIVPLTHLQRRPGNMWETELALRAPADMGVALAQVEPDSELVAEVRLESVLDGVLATASVHYQVIAECARCLEALEWGDSSEFVELFLYPETDSRGREIQGGDHEWVEGDYESVARFIENDSLDFEEVIRDAIVLDLPLKPLCDPDCQGLCATCGEKRDVGAHDHVVQDPRWAALESLREE